MGCDIRPTDTARQKQNVIFNLIQKQKVPFLVPPNLKEISGKSRTRRHGWISPSKCISNHRNVGYSEVSANLHEGKRLPEQTVLSVIWGC